MISSLKTIYLSIPMSPKFTLKRIYTNAAQSKSFLLYETKSCLYNGSMSFLDFMSNPIELAIECENMYIIAENMYP